MFILSQGPFSWSCSLQVRRCTKENWEGGRQELVFQTGQKAIPHHRVSFPVYTLREITWKGDSAGRRKGSLALVSVCGEEIYYVSHVEGFFHYIIINDNILLLLLFNIFTLFYSGFVFKLFLYQPKVLLSFSSPFHQGGRERRVLREQLPEA